MPCLSCATPRTCAPAIARSNLPVYVYVSRCVHEGACSRARYLADTWSAIYQPGISMQGRLVLRKAPPTTGRDNPATSLHITPWDHGRGNEVHVFNLARLGGAVCLTKRPSFTALAGVTAEAHVCGRGGRDEPRTSYTKGDMQCKQGRSAQANFAHVKGPAVGCRRLQRRLPDQEATAGLCLADIKDVAGDSRRTERKLEDLCPPRDDHIGGTANTRWLRLSAPEAKP